ncbi:MAG: polysaccharide deacetylase family protein [Gemmatimonadaceae bacterium]
MRAATTRGAKWRPSSFRHSALADGSLSAHPLPLVPPGAAAIAAITAITVLATCACQQLAGDPPPQSSAHVRASVRDESAGAVERASPPTLRATSDTIATGVRVPNEMGRIPILMYHIVGEKESAWQRTRAHFAADLELLYARGYRPITAAQLVDRRIGLPKGLSPVVFTFDDASPSQFRYIEMDGRLEVDPTSALGIWLTFRKTHPDWENRAVFCMLPAASAGHAFFGNGNIEGQKTAWRLAKVRFLAAQGFELCDHTLWHANLKKYSDAIVQEQIARGLVAIDSAVPNYHVRSFALPLGIWPRNHRLAQRGEWRDPKTGRVTRYDFDAIFEVWGHAVPSPFDPKFNPLSLQRIQVTGDALTRELDMLERTRQRYVSAGSR